jgi:hypothetical protein
MGIRDTYPPTATLDQFARAWWDALAAFAAAPDVAARGLAVALRAALVTDPQTPATVAAAWRQALADALTDPLAGPVCLHAILGLLDQTTALLEELIERSDTTAPG